MTGVHAGGPGGGGLDSSGGGGGGHDVSVGTGGRASKSTYMSMHESICHVCFLKADHFTASASPIILNPS